MQANEPPPFRQPLPGALRRVFRWIGRHARGFYGAVGSFLILGFVLVALTAVVVALLARWIRTEAIQQWDLAVLAWLDANRSPRLDFTMLELTALGSGTVTTLLVLVGGGFLWLTRHRYSAVLLALSGIGAGLLNTLLKAVFERPRPDLFEWLTHAGYTSFPSGHATLAAAVFPTLAYLVARLEPSRAVRRLTWTVAVLLVVLVGLTRPYLGVHYLSDVIAGWLVGLAWAAVCALGIEAVRYFRHREPGIAAVERDLDRGVAADRPRRAPWNRRDAAAS